MKHCTTNHRTPTDDIICGILRDFRRIAVVGASDKPWRDSNRIAGYLLAEGYTVLPVNPEIREVFGLPSFPDLALAPKPVEIVNIFRRHEFIPGIVAQAIEIGARAIWMQSGLEDPVAAETARRGGLAVVMNRCIMIEHRRHFS